MKRLFYFFFLPFYLLLTGAVAPDNQATATGEAVDIVTISGFTVAATNPLILCSAGIEVQSISGVTYNSIPMTPVGSELVQDSYAYLSLFQLTGQSGTHDAVFTFNGLCSSECTVACKSFTGVDQTTPIGTLQTSFDFASLPISITVPAGGMGYDTVAAIGATAGCGDLTTTASNTEVYEDCTGPTGSAVALAGSTILTTGTMSWDFVSGAYTLQIGVPINQATAATASIVTRRR